MVLTQKAIDKIKGNTDLKRELTYQLGISYSTLMRWVESNEHDGQQTTIRFINIVSEETGLTQKQILTAIDKDKNMAIL